jgi:hypothetical protein
MSCAANSFRTPRLIPEKAVFRPALALRPLPGSNGTNMERIGAIETRYAGHHFRSRLEARWAVFFDHLKVKWQYESQGFQNEAGDRYLPDFYLPESETWVEVKGDRHALVDDAARMSRLLASGSPLPGMNQSLGTSRGLILLGNIPADIEQSVWMHPVIQQGHGALYRNWGCFVALKTPATGSERGQWYPMSTSEEGINIGFFYDIDLVEISADDHWLVEEKRLRDCVRPMTRTLSAYTAARTARFEHGQSGAR